MDGQGATGRQITGQSAGTVVVRNDVLPVDLIVTELHDVVEEIAVRAPPHLKHIHQCVMDP